MTRRFCPSSLLIDFLPYKGSAPAPILLAYRTKSVPITGYNRKRDAEAAGHARQGGGCAGQGPTGAPGRRGRRQGRGLRRGKWLRQHTDARGLQGMPALATRLRLRHRKPHQARGARSTRDTRRVSTLPAAACQHAPYGRLSARSALRAPLVSTLRALQALACQLLPFWPRSAARDEPPPAALGFYAPGGGPRR